MYISFSFGYSTTEFTSRSLKLGNLLNPTIGFSVKMLAQSGLLEMIFQFLWIISLMLGLPGL